MMSSSRRGDTLSLRLLKLREYYNQEKHVWDIGCDHGLLGRSFQEISTVEKIHFVDPSMPVIEVLRKKLLDSYITKGAIYHQSGQTLTINSSSNCIFIAGMGGQEIGEIITHILPQLNSSSRIIISPHRKILELRLRLYELSVNLYKEEVIFEDGQFYQIMCLGQAAGSPISPYGEQLWEGELGDKYREHQINHFSQHRDGTSKGYLEYLKRMNILKTT